MLVLIECEDSSRYDRDGQWMTFNDVGEQITVLSCFKSKQAIFKQYNLALRNPPSLPLSYPCINL